ncbi:MAG: hypothetical protein GX802_01800 [Clostridiales bacterium]|jgi:hypothetical protein|nr:hypothetical protein [Clostridiales bacterium]
MKRVECPCCYGKTLFNERAFEKCSQCGWIDDYAQYEHPDFGGGVNRISLNEAKELYTKYKDDFRNHKDEWKRNQ